jgi:glycosyltransferase involved in cell wall biosynthesis
VGHAIRSVVEQTYGDLELIVIDDGSTDDTRSAVMARNDPRLLYIAQANRGQSAARNAGLRIARGKYVAFLDSDDVFRADKLEIQLSWMHAHPEVGLSLTAYAKINEMGLTAPIPIVCPCLRDTVGLSDLITGPVGSFSTAVVTSSWAQMAGPMDESLRCGEEWEWMMRMAIAGCQIRCLPMPLVFGRVHSQNMVRSPEAVGTFGLRVLESVFSRPDFPEDLKEQYAFARAQELARLAGLACVAGQSQAALSYAKLASKELSGRADNELHSTALQVVHIAWGLSLTEQPPPLSQLERALNSGPRTERRLAKALRAARFEAETTARFRRRDRSGAVKSAFLYARAAFPRIQNRGVFAMMLKSMIGR